MGLRFTVLASGSKGNASLLQVGNFGLLLDAGLGPRQLSARMQAVGASWQFVNAVLLTHTHTDHWNDRAFKELRRRRIPIYCHAEHHAMLLTYSRTFPALVKDGLVHAYEPTRLITPVSGLSCSPLVLRHDSGATFGFRFECAGDGEDEPCTLGYVADLGCWDGQLARALADVDILAVEFNHDVELQYSSGRNPELIARVLGDEGHLSNVQAAELVCEVIRLSQPGRPRHVVQLHLSQDCNRPNLAAETARALLRRKGHALELHTARQDHPGPMLTVGPRPATVVTKPASPSRLARAASNHTAPQSYLPGLESE